MRPARLLLVGALALSLGAGCTYTRTAQGPAGAELWIDYEVVTLEEEPVFVQVPVTYTDPTFRLYVDEDDVPEQEGRLARTEVEPWTSAGLFAAAGCTAPLCMSGGFCLANPGVFLILLGPLSEIFLMSGLNALASSLARPGWPTVPVVMACALLGLLPLAGLPFALRLPDEIIVTEPQAPSAALSPLPLIEEVPF